MLQPDADPKTTLCQNDTAPKRHGVCTSHALRLERLGNSATRYLSSMSGISAPLICRNPENLD